MKLLLIIQKRLMKGCRPRLPRGCLYRQRFHSLPTRPRKSRKQVKNTCAKHEHISSQGFSFRVKEIYKSDHKDAQNIYSNPNILRFFCKKKGEDVQMKAVRMLRLCSH